MTPARKKPKCKNAQIKPQQASQRSSIPFKPLYDHILLIGEGNLSFAVSLLKHHHCRYVTVTTYDTEKELLDKYGEQVKKNIEYIRSAAEENGSETQEEEEEEKHPDPESKDPSMADQDDVASTQKRKEVRMLFGIDARKLRKKRQLKSKRFDTIMFNFPHVGGLTKDQDRQVRANQELLLSFFQESTSLLTPSGSIIITLFTGKPYDLWDVKTLAKSCGLCVRRSSKFEKEIYPGYEHARTIGAVKSRGETGGGRWKGEDRDARCFIFEKIGRAIIRNLKTELGKKRKRGHGEGSDDES